MNLVLTAIFIGSMTITSYRSVHSQTDNSPFITSIGEHVHPHGVAVSRDLLSRWGGSLNYGDTIFIEGYGLKVVNDVMNARHKQSVDIWVATLNDERKVGIRYKRVWLVQSEFKEDSQWRKLIIKLLVGAQYVGSTLNRLLKMM